MANKRRSRIRRYRGVSLVEMMMTALILGFLTIGVVQLYRVGDRQQRTARFYTDAQVKTVEAIRRITRSVRHASAVMVNTSGTPTFWTSSDAASYQVSSASQIIVAVPQPTSVGSGSDYIRFYLSGTTLYAQRSDDTNAGLSIATGVTGLTFTYYQTTITSTGVNPPADVTTSGPANATEVLVTVTLKSGTVTTVETAYVDLRNKSLGI